MPRRRYDGRRMEVTLAQMRGLVRDPREVVLDVRSPEAYGAVHLPAALNIPTGELNERAPVELPDRSRAIVVYCTSPT
jgi:rhodanese-related sulfurtransferase